MALYDFRELKQILMNKGVALSDPITIELDMDHSQFNGVGIINGQKLNGFIYLNEWYREGAPKYHTRGCPAVVDVGGKDPRWRFATGFPVKYDRKIKDGIGIMQTIQVTGTLQKCRYCSPLDLGAILRQMPIPIRGLDGRNMNWGEVSRKYREEHKYMCEGCGKKYPPKYIHCHHRDHNKTNDTQNNLQCLCVKCHADIHQTMKEDRKYKYFMEYIYDGR